MKAVGIDLGTTNSLVAIVEDGKARVIAGPDGQGSIPSAVRYEPDGQIVVGRDARDQASLYPERSVLSVKRLIGRTKAEGQRFGMA